MSEADFAPSMENARLAMDAKRFSDAMQHACQALKLKPDDPATELLIATIEAKSGQIDKAIRSFQEIAHKRPSEFDAHFWLSVLHRSRGQFKESLRHGQRAIDFKPQEANLYSNLALTQMAQQDFAGARINIDRAIQLAPTDARNYELLGKSYWQQGRDNQALEAYEHAAKLAPSSLEAVFAMAQIASSLNQSEKAVRLAQKVVSQSPSSVVARLVLAGGLVDLGLTGPAEQQIETVLKMAPQNGVAHALVGMRLQSLGKMDEAKDAYRRSIKFAPDQGLSYCSLVRSSKVTEKDRPVLDKMEDLVRSGKVNPRGKSFLHFGLGKAYDDLGDFKAAISHFDRANEIAYRLKFGEEKFDPKKLEQYIDWTIWAFTEEFIKKAQSDAADAPIFVVGMMRSGTSLVEQILSSHSEVGGAGERAYWLLHASEAITPGSGYLDKNALRNIARSYIEELRHLFPHTPRVTDKMPGNYRVLGVIASAFPGAKFVHTKRNPIDTCLSIYMTPNRIANDFANNRENITFAYRQYRRLMDHWESVLGRHRLESVEYEQLVSEPEPAVRELLKFCDLPWDDACLHPESNERSVITPSVWQVRQPLYTSSVERWRNYEPWLGAFAELKELDG